MSMSGDDGRAADGPSPAETTRPLRRVRQYREFTREPPTRAELDAILNVARWSGSSTNTQPWRFLLIERSDVLQAVGQAGLPQTRALLTAPAAIAITLPDVADRIVSLAYDDGRVAERILAAASMLGLGAGITWVRADVRGPIQVLLQVPDGRYVRTIMAIGHPTEAARRPKAKPGEARLPLDALVLSEL
jgi:nitroreductase